MTGTDWQTGRPPQETRKATDYCTEPGGPRTLKSKETLKPPHLIKAASLKHHSATRRTSLQGLKLKTGGQPDMLLVLVFLCVAGGVWGSAPGVWGYGWIQDRQGPAAAASCPSPCQCEEDGIFVMVDCSELGLSSIPSNLSLLTTYL